MFCLEAGTLSKASILASLKERRKLTASGQQKLKSSSSQALPKERLAGLKRSPRDIVVAIEYSREKKNWPSRLALQMRTRAMYTKVKMYRNGGR